MWDLAAVVAVCSIAARDVAVGQTLELAAMTAVVCVAVWEALGAAAAVVAVLCIGVLWDADAAAAVVGYVLERAVAAAACALLMACEEKANPDGGRC